MGSKAVISRDEILDRAYERAMDSGLASLNVRMIAHECGVAVGTIYNYFPDKASLVTEVVTRFWMRAIAEGDLAAPASSAGGATNPQDSGARQTLRHVEHLYEGLRETLADFRESWLREISLLDARTLERTRAAERACFLGIIEDLARVIENDAEVREGLRARVSSQDLAEFIWSSLFSSLRAGNSDSSTLFALLEFALYA